MAKFILGEVEIKVHVMAGLKCCPWSGMQDGWLALCHNTNPILDSLKKKTIIIQPEFRKKNF